MNFKNNTIIYDDNFIKKAIKNNKFLCSNYLNIKFHLNKNKVEKIRKGNIFMLHTGRVGSTVLADLLNQHSKISWDGEFYPKQKKRYLKFIYNDPIDFLKIKMNQKVSEFYGFELKCSKNQLYTAHSINLDLDVFLDRIKELNFNNFILLERKNYLKQFISLYFARKTKIHHIKYNINKISILNIEFESCLWFNKQQPLIKHFEYLDNFYKETKDLLSKDKSLFLTYEDEIQENPLVAYEKICDFLNIKPELPIINLKRTNPYPLKDVIKNYNEVEKYLTGTKYEWMLKD